MDSEGISIRNATKRKIEELALGVLLITGMYGSVYLGGTLWGATGDWPERFTTTLSGQLFLACVAAWAGILGTWKLLALRRYLTTNPHAAHGDEVVTNLREGLDERE